MAKKDINKQPFPEATMLKLDIFRRCFREWFPVFVHHPSIKKIFIYDMFAGSGADSKGNPGSPIILFVAKETTKGIHYGNCIQSIVFPYKFTALVVMFLDGLNEGTDNFRCLARRTFLATSGQ